MGTVPLFFSGATAALMILANYSCPNPPSLQTYNQPHDLVVLAKHSWEMPWQLAIVLL
jgi:hypothetical protein